MTIVAKYYRYSEISGFDDFFCIVEKQDTLGRTYFTEVNEATYTDYRTERKIKGDTARHCIKSGLWRKKRE